MREFDVASALHSPPRLATLASMQTAVFDTYDLFKRLTVAGMPEPQAEVLAGEHSLLIHERLASKHDLKELEASIKRCEASIKALEVSAKKHEASIKKHEALIKEPEFSIKALQASMESNFERLEKNLVTKLGGLLFLGFTALAVLIIL